MWKVVAVCLLLALAMPLFADNIVTEIGDVMTPDEISGALMGGLDKNSKLEIVASWKLGTIEVKERKVCLFGDAWDIEPIGAGISAGREQTTVRFGIGYDGNRDCLTFYLRQSKKL